MTTAEQAQRAAAFRERHHQRPSLLLPNVWDGASARVFSDAGFDALATTSGGVAWALGYADGEAAPWDEVLAATRRIIRAARGAVTVDLEAGFAATRDALAAHVTAVIEAGAVGLNLEDSAPGSGHRLLPLDDAASRIAAARGAADATGVPIVINARIDLFLPRRGQDLSGFDEAVARARAYLAAGADCVYPIGLSALEAVERFVTAVAAPVNIAAQAEGPSLAALGAAGVARISTATAIATSSLAHLSAMAASLREGRFETLRATMTYPAIQQLFA